MRVYGSVSFFVCCAALATLIGCTAAAPRAARTSDVAIRTLPPVPVADDALAQRLAGEFALQAGDLATAARHFARAAALSDDGDVAEQATRLAIAVKDWPGASASLARWQALAPGAPALHQARAWIALGEHRDDDAFPELAALAGETDGWRLIAQALIEVGDANRAKPLLARLATPERLGAKEPTWIAVSQLAFKLGDKPLARSLGDAAVAKFHGGDSYAWRARLALDAGDKSGARTAYADALKRDPKSARLRIGYAALLSELGDNAAAARIVGEGPQDDLTYAARAAYGARADDKAALAILYRQIEADRSPRSGKRLFLLGQVAELIEKRAEAQSWYESVGEDDDEWFESQLRIAVVLDQQNKLDAALAHLHELEARAADDPKQLGESYLLEAELLSHRTRSKDALAAYDRGLTALPDDTRLLYARALLTAELDDVPQSERDLRRIIAIKPDDAEALNALGYTLADRTERRQEALSLIERALTIKPDEPAIIDSLGWVNYRLGNLDEASKQLKRAFEKQPDAEIAAHLGEVLWVKGDRDEARKVWDQGRKKDAKNKTLLETMKRLMS